MMIAKYIINPYPARLVLFISLGIFSVLNEVLGRDYFNPALLEHISSGSENIDLSGFEMGGQAQGTYHVDIILNGQFLDTQDIAFNKTPTPSGEDALEPCLSGKCCNAMALTSRSIRVCRARGLRRFVRYSTGFK